VVDRNRWRVTITWRASKHIPSWGGSLTIDWIHKRLKIYFIIELVEGLFVVLIIDLFGHFKKRLLLSRYQFMNDLCYSQVVNITFSIHNYNNFSVLTQIHCDKLDWKMFASKRILVYCPLYGKVHGRCTKILYFCI